MFVFHVLYSPKRPAKQTCPQRRFLHNRVTNVMKVLIVESEFLHQDTWVGNAVERLADALSQQNVTVIN